MKRSQQCINAHVNNGTDTISFLVIDLQVHIFRWESEREMFLQGVVRGVGVDVFYHQRSIEHERQSGACSPLPAVLARSE